MEHMLKQIEEEISNHPIILYMKGTKLMPMCGFSSIVVEILRSLDIEFETRNVLDDDQLREGIKQYSKWPTLPQLYVKGKFIGGCDIVRELFEKGELQELVAFAKS